MVPLRISLKDIFLINIFNDVKVEKFRQLPFFVDHALIETFLFACGAHSTSVSATLQ